MLNTLPKTNTTNFPITMSNSSNCFFLILCVFLNVIIPFFLSFLLLRKKGKWYKYFVVIPILFYIVGVISVLIIEYFEVHSNLFSSLFFCELCDKKYDLGTVIVIYQFGLQYIYLIPLISGSVIWLFKIMKHKNF